MCVDTTLGALNFANALQKFSDQYGGPTCATKQKFAFAHVICRQSFAGRNTDVSHRHSKLLTIVEFLGVCDIGVQNSGYFMFAWF
jgi:hypothetical protein